MQNKNEFISSMNDGSKFHWGARKTCPILPHRHVGTCKGSASHCKVLHAAKDSHSDKALSPAEPPDKQGSHQ
ncbi:hypothetical protein DPMN_041023 [Dreissena polymorpha]|uniref:Uncharacterized protein n=1 Tax=Dreissena polymorpha TaxID=45954 RepID=A0A9D4CYP4_DREPO|nr:hypothetical protein DPMN_041023 [Dreissena polymorpha]